MFIWYRIYVSCEIVRVKLVSFISEEIKLKSKFIYSAVVLSINTTYSL